MKGTCFWIVRHPEVDKKHPDGEGAPLTEEGIRQIRDLAYTGRIGKVNKLAIVPTENLPRFNDAAAEMARAGIDVHHVEGISFKNMKGNATTREIATKYREAGLALMRRLADDKSTPANVIIIGSYPLIVGLRYDPATATDEELEAKPDFCTGITAEIASNGVLVVTCSNYLTFSYD